MEQSRSLRGTGPDPVGSDNTPRYLGMQQPMSRGGATAKEQD
jgi:hypothetical protein